MMRSSLIKKERSENFARRMHCPDRVAYTELLQECKLSKKWLPERLLIRFATCGLRLFDRTSARGFEHYPSVDLRARA